MKALLMVILLVIVCLFMVNSVHTQISQDDLTSGNKYFESKYKKNLTGLWKSKTTEELILEMKTEKRYILRGDLKFSLDYTILEVRRYLLNGKDIAPYFKGPIEVSSFNSKNSYVGLYKDPVTRNNIDITLKYINRTRVEFSAMLPEIDVSNDPKKGTIFNNKTIELVK